MPCRSDYLAPNDREKELQRAAKLLVYVCEQTGRQPEGWMLATADNIYARDDRAVIQLCSTLKTMNPQLREVLVYNAHDAVARDLADWWEEHQKADVARELREAAQQTMPLTDAVGNTPPSPGWDTARERC